MKMDEELGQDRDSSFLTDDEEKQSSLASSDDEDDDGNYRSSSPLSRNHSDDSPSPWPRSYRRSMDMLTGVTPPTVSFIPRSGSRTLSSNADSSFCKRRQNSCQDSFSSSASKPLISQSIHGKEEIRTSALISAIEFISSQLELSIADHPFPPENRCSFSQSVLNGVNVLCGLALLTMPYALKEGGWIGLFVLLLFGIITCYTGILLKRCAESSPGLTTYPDIGHAAFGMTGRVIISILLYLELYIFAVATTVIVLPTVWLRDLSLLSYLSVGGVLSSILLALCLLWNGSVDGVGFHLTGQALDLTNLPVSVGIFGLGFAGHSVFPNLYSSMKEPSKFPLVLVICFGFCTFLYIGVAICGYTMFGDAIQSQFTLNMPKQFLTSRIAVWTAVVTPMTKYALTITPVVLSLEELMPSSKMKPYGSSILLRTILVISTLVVALAVPFFAIVGALMGSFLAVLVALIFPCMCYLSILKGRLSNTQVGICILIIIFGLVAGCCGTYSAVARLIGELT
ncbi:PREDICTED: vacuolar amino acid transporter 1-like isoform X2 [Tarenaya hassleriana]|uniref:vacuolar amino acid transporter 1-like isoform X2 n=1 Tax=Tarenaya hassleriana TaxID=28532 RepID=UPI00053C695C|nr:PREDICTED: vacuolar amino acid transporter 1-like isoform X2 [Tarenaya hassleriana]